MNHTTTTRKAKFAVAIIAASLFSACTCHAAEAPQPQLRIQRSMISIWIRLGPLPKHCDPGIFKRSLVGPIYQYIDDPLDSKPIPTDQQSQADLIARNGDASYGACS